MASVSGPDSFATHDFLARLRAKEPAALEEVVQAYLDQIFRAARGTGLNQEQAEDVTQATFMTFLETANRFEGRSHVRTWLFGILYKKVAESRRQIKRNGQTEDIEEILERRFDSGGKWVRPPQPADRDLQDAEIRTHIESCLEQASPRQRLAFILREVEGLSSPEICNTLDVTLTNLGVLLYRVRNLLRECLEKLGFMK